MHKLLFILVAIFAFAKVVLCDEGATEVVDEGEGEDLEEEVHMP